MIPSLFLSPGGGGTTGIQAQDCTFCVLLGLLGRFFALPERASKMTSKKHGKKSENQGFWPPQTLPKAVQNGFKMGLPKDMRFFIDFCSKNAMLQKCRHRFRIGFCNTDCLSDTFRHIAFCMHLRSEKPTKNPSKTRSEPFQNRC